MEMSEGERRCFKVWQAEMSPRIDFREETHLDIVKNIMKNAAYHEAGHAAANAFLGTYGISNVDRITIIPNKTFNGRIPCSCHYSRSVKHFQEGKNGT